MINLNELRIGNWIDEQGLKLQVGWIQTGLFESSEPIPLTEDVLVNKCGFKMWGRVEFPRTISYELGEFHIFPANSSCDFKGYGFIHYKLSDEINNENKGIIESAMFKFEHLHQLQNLYWCLVGKELDVQL